MKNENIVSEENPIGSIIKTKRKIAGMRMKDVSDITGLSLDAINRIEANDRVISFMNIVKLVNALGYDVVVKKSEYEK